jgi:hypothetical protein
MGAERRLNRLYAKESLLAQLIPQNFLHGSLVVQLTEELHSMNEFFVRLEKILAQESQAAPILGDASPSDRNSYRPAD